MKVQEIARYFWNMRYFQKFQLSTSKRCCCKGGKRGDWQTRAAVGLEEVCATWIDVQQEEAQYNRDLLFPQDPKPLSDRTVWS